MITRLATDLSSIFLAQADTTRSKRGRRKANKNEASIVENKNPNAEATQKKKASAPARDEFEGMRFRYDMANISLWGPQDIYQDKRHYFSNVTSGRGNFEITEKVYGAFGVTFSYPRIPNEYVSTNNIVNGSPSSSMRLHDARAQLILNASPFMGHIYGGYGFFSNDTLYRLNEAATWHCTLEDKNRETLYQTNYGGVIPITNLPPTWMIGIGGGYKINKLSLYTTFSAQQAYQNKELRSIQDYLRKQPGYDPSLSDYSNDAASGSIMDNRWLRWSAMAELYGARLALTGNDYHYNDGYKAYTNEARTSTETVSYSGQSVQIDFGFPIYPLSLISKNWARDLIIRPAYGFEHETIRRDGDYRVYGKFYSKMVKHTFGGEATVKLPGNFEITGGYYRVNRNYEFFSGELPSGYNSLLDYNIYGANLRWRSKSFPVDLLAGAKSLDNGETNFWDRTTVYFGAEMRIDSSFDSSAQRLVKSMAPVLHRISTGEEYVDPAAKAKDNTRK